LVDLPLGVGDEVGFREGVDMVVVRWMW
jgi:hypothetical protein